MKQSETIVSKRLRQLKVLVVLLLLLTAARVGYMKLLYTSEFAVKQKQTIEASGTSILANFRNAPNLAGFHAVTREEIIQNSKDDPSLLSVLAAVNQFCQKGCEGAPMLFFKEHTAIVLYQNKDGEQHAAQLQKSQNEWVNAGKAD
ncbi:hypothetical protein [Ectobacillus ponti]|uniref:hypothetical protein n=1 Tax=Ectobacillus ponti TaxID=2961894 RepID=UPI0020C905E4|nr:hypothetical protein [Ectobacillus ponti]